jgi:tRNA-dihydrouridine synthase B
MPGLKVNCGMVRIFGFDVTGRAVLAPMAGITDTPFRLLARECGASLVFTELVSADGLVRSSEKTFKLMEFQPQERPIGIQLFGADPFIMGEAARLAESVQPDWIDLNFGCPAKKVVRRGAGAALLTDLERLKQIAGRVVSIVHLPVSAKIRSGWEEGKPVAVEAARILESEGVAAVTVHARTRQAGFKGRADWSVIREVREAVSIPVIGNGDAASAGEAERMIRETGCDLVMIGRGALGRPWIFSMMNPAPGRGDQAVEPGYRERIDICLRHYRLALQYRPASKAVKEMRKHIAWYIKGMPGAAEFRKEAFTLMDADEVMRRLEEFKNRLG